MKVFNTTGACNPKRHYMINLSRRLEEIKNMVDRGDYFTLNRSRQYGKTTTLLQLCEYLKDSYDIIRLDFQRIGDEDFATAGVFVNTLAKQILEASDRDKTPAIHSVILAGVTDVKHLRSKVRPEEAHKLNSPWNIAKDFLMDMSFSADDIAGMLEQYVAEEHAVMNTREVAGTIREYTSGYPFLVSRICELIHDHSLGWSHHGVAEAVKLVLMEKNTLFDSLMGKLTNMPKLKQMLRETLMKGKTVSYNPDHEDTRQLEMYGFIINDNQRVVIANRIFEMRLYNYFLLEEELKSNAFSAEGDADKNSFIKDGALDLENVLDRFVVAYHDILGDPADGERFREKDGRELFLLYLKPIINGTGNYYIEAQTRDQTRTDVIVDYNGEQFVIELKIWHGDSYHKRGEKQLSDYLDHFRLQKGYMLSFCFNEKKTTGVQTVRVGDKELVEAVV